MRRRSRTRKADTTWAHTTNRVEHVERGNYYGENPSGHYSNKHQKHTSMCFIGTEIGARRTVSIKKGIGIK